MTEEMKPETTTPEMPAAEPATETAPEVAPEPAVETPAAE